MSLCGRTSVFPLAYGFPHGKHVLNFTRDSKLLSKELWSLLIISMASEFPVSPHSHPSSHLHVKSSVFLC